MTQVARYKCLTCSELKKATAAFELHLDFCPDGMFIPLRIYEIGKAPKRYGTTQKHLCVDCATAITNFLVGLTGDWVRKWEHLSVLEILARDYKRTKKGEAAADKEVVRLQNVNCQLIAYVDELTERHNTNQQGGNMSQDLKDLREKVRKNKRDINDLQHDVNALKEDNDELAELYTDLEVRVTKLELGGPIEPEEPSDYPVFVHDLPTLRQFIIANFGEDYLIQHSTSRRTLCGPVRDALATRYPNDIERVNDQQIRHGYSAAEEKHRDAIYYFDQPAGVWTIIDFCRASSDAGTLENNLQWVPVTETPWN